MAFSLDKFLNQFYSEAKEKLENIENNLIEFENNPNNLEIAQQIQRDMHTIKGSSRMVGLSEIGDIAHKFEDLFLEISNENIKPNKLIFDLLLKGIDSIKELIEKSKKKEKLSSFKNLINEIENIIEKRGLIEEGIKTEKKPNKKKFKIDFESLKFKFSEKKDKKQKKEKKHDKKRILKEKESKKLIKEEVKPEDEKKEKLEHKRFKHEFIKIDSKKISRVLNSITDIISKKYFLKKTIHDNNELIYYFEKFKNEWFKEVNELNIKNSKLEILNKSIDVIFRKIINNTREYNLSLTNFENLLNNHYDLILDLKLTPLSSIFNLFPRFVRDYSHKTNKKIRIFIRGADTLLDKNIIEKLNEPFIHLIRNSCDHGIETPEERKKKGKPEVGNIIIEAKRKGNRVEISIKDDGRGLDNEKIIKKAIKMGVIDQKIADKLSFAETHNLIFESGLSTSKLITETSGRGIGMDVVKRILQELNGNILIKSEKNRGTEFIIDVPVSIFTNRILFIKDNKTVYAIPSSMIKKIFSIKASEIKQKHDYSVVIYKGEIFTVAKLSSILNSTESEINPNDNLFIIIPKIGEKKIGIIVDNILYEKDAIIKETGDFLGKQKFVYGIVIGERGELIIIIDMFDIDSYFSLNKRAKITQEIKPKDNRKKLILIVEDSLLVREMEKNVLESAGYNVHLATNGIEGLDMVASNKYDLILSDIEMPEMDGFEMIENIKKNPEHQNIPIVILSTKDSDEDKIRGVKIGADAYLNKQEFNEKEFLEVIKKLI